MDTFKKDFHRKLLQSLVLGHSAAEAAREAGCSEPTARKFRNANIDEIRSLQRQSSTGVLDALKKLLPEAVQTLEKQLRNCETKGPADAVRVVRAVFDAFDVMRDVEMERRMAALEEQLAALGARQCAPAASSTAPPCKVVASR
jgi:hypothetical protein